MTATCKGLTLLGKQCNRRMKRSEYCFQHRHLFNKYAQDKPDECIVCCESLSNQHYPLECGHWIHTHCIISSGKAQCPLCRKKLKLNRNAMKQIREISKKHQQEAMESEEEELRSINEHISDILNDMMSDSDTDDSLFGDILDELLFYNYI